MTTVTLWMLAPKNNSEENPVFLGVDDKGALKCMDDFRKAWAWNSRNEALDFLEAFNLSHPKLAEFISDFDIVECEVAPIEQAN